MPWETAQAVLASLDIPRGKGWEKTLQKLAKFKATAKQSEQLEHALKSHIMCGEKLTQFFTLSDAEMKSLRAIVIKLVPLDSIFKSTYPGLLSAKQLEKAEPGLPQLVAIEKTDDGVGLVFGSIRVVELREPLDPGELPKDVAKALADYSELFGVKLVKLQAMDVVWIPHQGNLVDVRADFLKGIPRDVGLAAQKATRATLNELAKKDYLSKEANLFPLIDKMYRAPKEGTVVELGFGTKTASLKHEKMRRAHACLRDEKYHKAGKAALNGSIEPFKLSIEWEIELGNDVVSRPELTFNGNALIGGAQNPILNEAVFRRCTGLGDFEFIRSRIEHYLTA